MQSQGVNWMQWIIGVIVAVIVLGLFAGWFTPDIPEPQNQTLYIPTAAEIAALIVVPSTDNAKLDRVCELTDGCEFYEGSMRWLSELDDEDAWDDFEDWLEEYSDIDNEDLDYDYDMKDWQVRAYTESDMDDENYEVQVFVKISYWDTDDSDDRDKVYLLITSTLDEGEYEDMSIEVVSRNFEFA